MIDKLQGVYPMDDFVLGCKFRDGAVKLYDMRPLMQNNSAFGYFLENPDLFKQASVRPDGRGIAWNDELTLAEEELQANGWPEWEENTLVTVEFELDSELFSQAAEQLKPYGLTPEDWMVMFLETLVLYPPTQEKAAAALLNLRNDHSGLGEKS